MALGPVRHVLERLAVPAQRVDEFGRLLRVDPLVLLAVGDEDRNSEALGAMNRRTGLVGRPLQRWMAHHPLQVETADEVALGPRGEDVAVPVLRRRTGVAVVLVVDHRDEREVRAVARPEDADAGRVDPAERRQVVVGGEAVLGVVDAPDAVVGSFEVTSVRRAAPEVDREPAVALVDEVLGDAVPLVTSARGRAAVRVDDRRHRVSAMTPPADGTASRRPRYRRASDSRHVRGRCAAPPERRLGSGRTVP